MTPNPPADAAGLASPARPGTCTRTLSRWELGCIALSCAGVLVGLRLAVAWQWPLPFCLLRKLTGIPCPACGCTRSLLAWTNLDPAAAFLANPLFALGCLAGAGWLLLRATDRWTGRLWATKLALAGRRLPQGRLLIGLAALNWLYLLFNLPK